MVLLTENATTAIRKIVDRPELPDSAGVRIASGDGASSNLTVAVTPTPEPGDQIVEAEGARVFLDPDAATLLDDQVLDAEVDPQGSVSFRAAAQGLGLDS